MVASTIERDALVLLVRSGEGEGEEELLEDSVLGCTRLL
jgi:hypothetical protein